MKPSRFEFTKSLVCLFLAVSLLTGEVSPQQGRLSPACEASEQSCACLLERVGSSSQQATAASKAPAPLASYGEPKLLALSTQPADAAKILRGAEPSDIFVLDQTGILDNALLDRLRRSRATYVLKSNKEDLNSVRNMLAQPIGKPEYAVAIPTDDVGVRNVFGVSTKNSAAAVSYLSRLYWEYKKLQRVSLFYQSASLGSSIADQILSKASDPKAQNLFVVVAHNQKGSLRFPDGSALRISKLQDLLTTRGRPGLILSCDTVQAIEDSAPGAILTGKSLDFAAIRKALSKIDRTSQNKAASFAEALVVSSSAIAGPKVEKDKVIFVAFAVIGFLVVGGSIYFWICGDRSNSKC